MVLFIRQRVFGSRDHKLQSSSRIYIRTFIVFAINKWYYTNLARINFDEDKTKYILFSKEINLPELNITYNNNRIKQFHIVEYLGCYLEVSLGGEGLAIKSLKKISAKLQILYRQNEFLNPKSRLLCNFLMQPHFDYAWVSW